MKVTQQQAAQPVPGCTPGDEIWLKHPDGPVQAKVLSHGQHGLTVDVGGKQHRVKWDKYHGHKKRVALNMQVEDEGEDGMVVRDQSGRRHYVAVPPEAREERMVVKSQGSGARLLVFSKALNPAEDKKPGGWVENAKAPASRGHHVAFKHGDYAGHGQVKAVGRDGVTVQDKACGRHMVPHNAVTHRWEGDGKPDSGPGEPKGEGDVIRDFMTALLAGAPDGVKQWVEQFVAKQSQTSPVDQESSKPDA